MMDFKEYEEGDEDYLSYWFMWLGMFSFLYFMVSALTVVLGAK